MNKTLIRFHDTFLKKRRGWRLQLEWKVEDLWIGVFWRRVNNAHACMRFFDLWVCLLPCLPIHLSTWRNDVSVEHN